MANIDKLLSCLLLVEFLQLLFIFESTKCSGLSIKLIHRHSPDSPFYPGNITSDERIRLLVQTASSYASRLSSAISSGIKTNSSNHTTTTNPIRPKMDNQGVMYLVQVGIGTFDAPRRPFFNYFLHLDPALDLLWTQCKPEIGRGSYFRQVEPIFPASQSHTYHPLPCGKHKLCSDRCINGTCSYSFRYGDGASTIGYLAYESLTFDSDNSKSETIRQIVFGCGFENTRFSESSKYNKVAGTFGFGAGKRSFLWQKRDLTLGRFSYCLPPHEAAHNSPIYLRFGTDIPQREGLQVTRLTTMKGSFFYYLNLEGISVGNSKLDIPPKMFAPRNKSYGGCIIDSGSPFTAMPRPVYEKLEERLISNRFLRYTRLEKQGSFDLCYLFPPRAGLRDLPTITFHLRKADLVFPPEVGFVQGWTTSSEHYFCLGMAPRNFDGMTVIGATQQANKRFIFDALKRELYFGPEDCTRGA